MSNEGYLFEMCTHTTSGAKWALDYFSSIYEVEQAQIKKYGSFVQEDEAIQQFRELLAPTLEKAVVPMKEEDVDWELLFNRFRDWYKNIRESADKKKREESSLRRGTDDGNADNPFDNLKNDIDKSDEAEENRKNKYDAGLELVEKFNPIVVRVLQLYVDTREEEFLFSKLETDYDQFQNDQNALNTDILYTWDMRNVHSKFDFSEGVVSGGNPSALSAFLTCERDGWFFIDISMYSRSGEKGSERITLNISNEEFEQNLIDAIKSLHRKLVD